MRHVVICLLCGIAVMTMAASVLAQDADPCAGITCHDNSKCAVRDSKLVCVCDKGYQAEADGSGCKPKPKECTSDGDCRNLPVCYQNRCMTRNQRLTIKTNANLLIVPGAILIPVGAAGIIWGAIVLADADVEWVGGHLWIWDAFIGGIILAPGIIVFASGLMLLTIGLVKRKKIKSGKLAFDIRTRHGKITLEPTIAAGENGGVFGLSGRF